MKNAKIIYEDIVHIARNEVFVFCSHSPNNIKFVTIQAHVFFHFIYRFSFRTKDSKILVNIFIRDEIL